MCIRKWAWSLTSNSIWTEEARSTFVGEDGAGKLARNTFNFSKPNKGDLEIQFQWNALNKPAKMGYKTNHT